ncbi:hypothetical protein [Fimbriiglobus ruber]|uniref:Methyltransferase domain-containing protein n=1 Tax=Fimbriiglobus ruber TaxID=1908690 RepID=A0A225D0V9_9BACT|nr:hypothetical protein [Fimbriiglobus ruber]OWK35142.1 hypothetical protein FRUB_09984 [Fimbriiglobus ruber]
MPLIDLSVPTDGAPPPADVRRFLREADRRIEDCLSSSRITGFVPSNYPGAYEILQSLISSSVIRGPLFCEWGSGYGVVTGLAAGLGYDAHGIEAEGELVDSARQLAEDFGLDTTFAHGSFVPRGGEERVLTAGNYSWLITDADYAYEDLGLDLADFDVVYAYPWPDEEDVTAQLFERYAGDGAVLLTFHGGTDFRLRRKAGRRKKRK